MKETSHRYKVAGIYKVSLPGRQVQRANFDFQQVKENTKREEMVSIAHMRTPGHHGQGHWVKTWGHWKTAKTSKLTILYFLKYNPSSKRYCAFLQKKITYFYAACFDF